MSNYLKGGQGDNKKLSNFDPKEVRLGIETETAEHASKSKSKKVKAMVRELVIDHLADDPRAYSTEKKNEQLESIIEGFIYDCTRL